MALPLQIYLVVRFLGFLLLCVGCDLASAPLDTEWTDATYDTEKTPLSHHSNGRVRRSRTLSNVDGTYLEQEYASDGEFREITWFKEGAPFASSRTVRVDAKRRRSEDWQLHEDKLVLREEERYTLIDPEREAKTRLYLENRRLERIRYFSPNGTLRLEDDYQGESSEEDPYARTLYDENGKRAESFEYLSDRAGHVFGFERYRDGKTYRYDNRLRPSLKASPPHAVRVAVLDTGADLTHPGLLDRWWNNPKEIPGNERDDDGNGVVDDQLGANLGDKTSSPTPWPVEWMPTMHKPSERADIAKEKTPGFHGTHVLGIVAAHSTARLVALTGDVASDKVGERLSRYLEHTPIDVLNGSFGYDFHRQQLDVPRFEGINRAIQQNPQVLFVFAAGNAGTDFDEHPDRLHPPASFRNANQISVAAESNGALAEFSNRGRFAADLAAPGVDIDSLAPGGDRVRFSGTSMASPRVAAAAAEVKKALLTHESVERFHEDTALLIKAILLTTVAIDHDAPLPVRSRGRLDQRRAVAVAKRVSKASELEDALEQEFGTEELSRRKKLWGSIGSLASTGL